MNNDTEIINYQSEQIVTKGEVEKDIYFNITDELTGCYTILPWIHLFLNFEWDEQFYATLASFKAILTIHKTDVNGLRTLAYRHEMLEINRGAACTFPVRTRFYRIEEPETQSVDFHLEITVEKSPEVKVPYENVFVKTDVNETPLEVEGKILYVNKGFLSVHSNYFKCLFSKDYIDSTKPVIPVKLGTLEELGILFSVFYPKYKTKIQDHHILQLLELAIRFQVPAVTERVEFHLAKKAVMNKAKKLWIAEKFGLPKVIKEILRIMKECGRDKHLASMKNSPYWAELSDELRKTLEEFCNYNR